MIFGTGITIVASVYPPGERGKALGIVLTAVYVGLSAGPFLGGMLTEYLGWQSLFLTNIIIGTIVVVITLWKIREDWAEAKGESFDITGSILYIAAFTATAYGTNRLSSESELVAMQAAGMPVTVADCRAKSGLTGEWPRR